VDSAIDALGLPDRKFCVDRDIGLIIVRDDSTRNRIKNVMDGTILTPYEAKGLERDSVFIVDFFSHKDAGFLWSVASKEILRLGEMIQKHNKGLHDLTKEENQEAA
jgi:site-specific recombinase